MSSVKNIDYKKITFFRSDGIMIDLIVSMIDPFDVNENFLVLKTENITSPKEIRLFYWIDRKRWTLNEFIFFALNNDLCLKISDKNNNEITSYGNCTVSNRIFGFAFGINFN
jgi:hypothetical protein